MPTLRIPRTLVCESSERDSSARDVPDQSDCSDYRTKDRELIDDVRDCIHTRGVIRPALNRHSGPQLANIASGYLQAVFRFRIR
jgi:hypothetical protein